MADRNSKSTSIALLCTDLDGTLLDESGSIDGILRFREALQWCTDHWRTSWAVITGRRKMDTDPALQQFLIHGLRPDFLVVEDGLIYRPRRRGGYGPFWWWNFRVLRKRFHLGRGSSDDIVRWRYELMSQYPGAVDRSRQTVDLWLEFGSEEETLRAELTLLDKLEDSDDFNVFRWNRELFLAPAAGTKGDAVGRLAKKLRLSPANIFTVGDGPNDLSMLNGEAAHLPACVGNALDKVKETVRRSGGYVAEGSSADGVVEAIQWYTGKPPAPKDLSH